MGTHPIFESDFDCLTVLDMSKRRSNLEASEKLSQLNQRIVRQPKKEVKDSDIERGLYVLFAKDSMLEKGKPPFVRFSEMKKMKFKGDKAHGFLDKELTQPLRRKDCYVGREVYYWFGYQETPHDDFPKEAEMDSFMRFRLATIIRLADSDAPPKEEIKVEVMEEPGIEDNITKEVIEEDSEEEKPVIPARTRENDALRQKKPELKPEQMKFLIEHLNFDKKIVEAEGGKYILQAMRMVIERKQDQLRKTEKQAMIFENLTINNY